MSEKKPQARCIATGLPVWNIVTNGQPFIRCSGERPFGGNVFKIESRESGVCELCTAVEKTHRSKP